MKAASGSIFNFAKKPSKTPKKPPKKSKGLLKTLFNKLIKKAETKAKTQSQKKTHTEKVGESRSPKRMTDGAKKEQKKALKEIKTTIQKTGSRLSAAGTAAASRQKSRKTRTEKVGTSGNPRKKMSSSAKKAAKETFDIHPILDALGFVPVLGEPADFVNGLIYASEEDYINAGLSMAAVIPAIRENRDKAVIQEIIKDLSGREEKSQEDGG